MKVYAQWLEYPAGVGPYGSGGWSRNARRKPAPVLKEVIADGVPGKSGKTWLIGSVGKRKLNLWSMEDGSELRRDYPDYVAPSWLREPLLRAAKLGGAA